MSNSTVKSAPAQWNHLPANEAKESFRPEFYTKGKHLQQISDKQLQMSGELIDWKLLRTTGYVRR
ncbi:MAG: hypothetical protein FIA91_05175 [Geobacter sp.]|nr:hypothetical protein [Geobacter sp.]